MITSEIPDSWQNLQSLVGRILKNCGFKVEVEKKITTARGTVEVDVFAVEDVSGRKYSIACECKYWKANIPQSVIHSFRTVVQDLGCNIGYIITTSKYQSGALSAVEHTNIQLLIWEEFQKLFLESWYLKFFTHQLKERIKFPHDWQSIPYYQNLNADDKAAFEFNNAKLWWLDRLILNFPNESWLENPPKPIAPRLPLKKTKFDNRKHYKGYDLPFEVYDETGYMEILATMISLGDELAKQLWVLRRKYYPWKSD